VPRMNRDDGLRRVILEYYRAAAVRSRAAGRECCPDVAPPDCCGRGVDAPQQSESGLGCANLVALVPLYPGENLLDIGSGPGLETIRLARMVDPGIAYGLDLLPEMIHLAQENARRARCRNVRFIQGPMEDIPLEDASVDVVVSNCVINLSTDKARVMKEMARVLRPGGRICIADPVWLAPPPQTVRQDAQAWACCVGGALERDEWPGLLTEAGFQEIDIRLLGEFAAEEGDTPYQQGGCHCCSGPAPEGGHNALASALISARRPPAPRLQSVHLRKASGSDLQIMLKILEAAGLPTAGVAEHLGHFLVAVDEHSRIVGMAGLECYSSAALLRSVVVLPAWRRLGLARRLIERLTRSLPAGTDVYLLTVGAEGYFRTLGFRPVGREQVPPELIQSREFQGACPETATVMRAQLPLPVR